MNQSAQNANNLINWYLGFVGVVSPLSEIEVQTVSYLPLFLDRRVAIHWQHHVNNTMSLKTWVFFFCLLFWSKENITVEKDEVFHVIFWSRDKGKSNELSIK